MRSGFHITCSMRVAPVASMTRRSKPSAMPQACGIVRQCGKEILIDRIALAVDALASRPSRASKPPALLDRRRSIRQSRSRARRRRHKARSARRRADRPVPAAPAPACVDRILDREWSRGRCRDWPSILSTSTRLKMSPQVSSSPTRIPAAARPRAKRVAVRLAVRQRRQQIDAGEARESLGDRQPFRLGERIGRPAAKRQVAASRRPRAASASIAAQSAIRSRKARRRDTIRHG